MKTAPKFIAFIALSVVLSACGQNSSSSSLTVGQANANALKAIRGQTLAWTGCDTSIIPDNVRSAVLAQIGTRLQCADVTVPMDWKNPSHGNASFSLLRVSAADSAKRQGAIFFNPGGPGGDGLLFGAIYGYLWSKGDPSTASGAALKTLSEQYDLIGFSPRGTGDSSELTCGSNAATSPEHNPSTDRSQKNIDAMLRNAKLVANACSKSTFAPYVSTAQTVQDLDLARKLMGEAKFNYVGYSYGTWLGSWYAKTFPMNTGKMLLDGNMDFSHEIEKSFENQPLGFERAFREVALGFAARHDNVLGLGSTPDAVYSVYDSFQPDLKLALRGYGAHNITQDLYSDDTIPDISIELVAARGVSNLITKNPGVTDAADLSDQLAAYTFAQNAEVNEAARELAYPLAASYYDIVNEVPGSVTLNPDHAVFHAVMCNDGSVDKDPQHWIDLGNQLAQQYPLIGGQVTENPCIYWKNQPASLPALPTNMPPFLMLQNEDDPATPREGAFNAFKSTPSAKMIFIDNEGEHTAFPYGSDCVNVPIANYFLTGALPTDRFTVCQALPLPGEAQVYPYGQTYTNGVGPQSLGSAAVAGAVRVNPFGTSNQDVVKLAKDILKRNTISPLN